MSSTFFDREKHKGPLMNHDNDGGHYIWYILIEPGGYVNGVRVMRLFKPVGRLSWIRYMRPVLPKERSVETIHKTLVVTPITSTYFTPYQKTSPWIFFILGSLVMAVVAMAFYLFKKNKK